MAHIGQELGLGPVGGLRIGLLAGILLGKICQALRLLLQLGPRLLQIADGIHQLALGIH